MKGEPFLTDEVREVVVLWCPKAHEKHLHAARMRRTPTYEVPHDDEWPGRCLADKGRGGASSDTPPLPPVKSDDIMRRAEWLAKWATSHPRWCETQEAENLRDNIRELLRWLAEAKPTDPDSAKQEETA